MHTYIDVPISAHKVRRYCRTYPLSVCPMTRCCDLMNFRKLNALPCLPCLLVSAKLTGHSSSNNSRYLNTLTNPKLGGTGAIEMIRATLRDIEESGEKGRWWLTGAAWVGNIGQHGAAAAAAATTAGSAPASGSGLAAVHDERLLALAKAQRMNTDVRRSVFCVIMGSNDFLDAYVGVATDL